MKTLFIASFLLLCLPPIQAQRFSDYDSLRRHELSAGFLPVFNLLSAQRPGQQSPFSLFYKYHTQKKWVLRSGLLIYPGTSLGYNDGMLQFSRSIDSINVFYSQSTYRQPTFQLNAGLEKIFSAGRIQQSIGADIWINRYQRYHQSTYVWYPDTISLERGNFAALPFTPVKGGPGIYNGVDSLSYGYGISGIGAGMQLFYNLRFRLHDKWYLNATAGPWFNMGFYRFRNASGRFASDHRSRLIESDILFMLVSDLSVAFRF